MPSNPTWEDTVALADEPTWESTEPQWDDTQPLESRGPSASMEVPQPSIKPPAPRQPTAEDQQQLRMIEVGRLKERYEMALGFTSVNMDPLKKERLREDYFKQLRALGVDPVNIQPDLVQTALTPTIQFEGDPEGIKQAFPGTTGKVLAGVNKAAANAASAMTSPLGIVTLGQGVLPKTAQQVASGAFAVDMGRHIPEQISATVDAFKRGDTEAAFEHGTGLMLNSAFTAAAGKHAVKPATPMSKAASDLDSIIQKTELPKGEITFKDATVEKQMMAEITAKAEQVAPLTAEVLKDLTGPPKVLESTQPAITKSEAVLKGGEPESRIESKTDVATAVADLPRRTDGEPLPRTDEVVAQPRTEIDTPPPARETPRLEEATAPRIEKEGVDFSAELAKPETQSAIEKSLKVLGVSEQNLPDALQEVNRIALTRAKSYDPARASVPTFVNKIARSYVIDAHRAATAKKRGGGVEKVSLDEDIGEGVTMRDTIEGSTSPDAELAASDRNRMVREVVAGLPEKDRVAVESVMSGEADPASLSPRLRKRIREAMVKRSSLDEVLESLKVDTSGKVYDAVQGIPIAAWNGSIDAVRASIKGGRILAEAADEGIKWLRENHPELKFDDAEYRAQILGGIPKVPSQQFQSQSERKGTTALRFVADSPEFQKQFPVEAEAIKKRTYVAQTEKGREAMASAYLEAYSKDGVIDVRSAWRDLQSTDLMSGADNATHMVTVARLANESMRRAVEAKNDIERLHYEQLTDDMLAMIQGKSSSFGQGLQATVQAAEQMFGAEAVAKARASITEKQTKGASGDVPVNTVPEVEKAVKKSGKDAAENSDIERFADYENTVSNEIIEDTLPKYGPKSKLATENLRRILAEVKQDVKDLIPKADPNKPRSPEEIMRGKLEREEMSKRAFEMLQAKVRQLVKEKPALAAEFKEILEAKWDSSKATDNINTAMRLALGDLDFVLRDILRQSVETQGNIRNEILTRILDHPTLQGLADADAVRITDALHKAWAEQQQRTLLKQFSKYAPLPKVSQKGRAAIREKLAELIELSNTGALTHEAFYNVIADKFGLPKFTPKIAKDIFDLAQKAQKAPEGMARNKAVAEVFDHIKRQTGATKQELLTSWWYASVLSGSGTQLVNNVGNAVMMANEMVMHAAREPKSAPRMAIAALRGMAQNIVSGEFGAIMRGDMSGRIGKNLGEGSHVFEVVKGSPNPFVRLLARGRYVTRFMVAIDSLFKDANLEAKAIFDTYRKVNGRDLTKADLDTAIADMLKLTKEDRARAEAKADKEVAEGKVEKSDRNRRVVELLRKERPPEIMESTEKFSLEATLNNEPDVSTLLGTAYKSLVAFREKHPVVTPFIPFLRIAANAGNQLINHSPLALWKMIARRPAEFRKGLPPKDAFTLDEYQQLRAKVVISHAVGMSMMALVASSLDEDDPTIQLSGSGQNIDPNKKKQLYAQGWRPYRLKIGDTWFDYRYTPYALMFGSIGSFADGKRYGNLDEKGAHVAFATMIRSGYWTILDQAALSTLSDVLGRGTFSSAESMPESLTRFVARTAGGLIPTAAKEFETFINPEIQQAIDWHDYFMRENPMGRWSINQPMLNILGEPVENPRYPWRRVMSPAASEPIWKALSEKANSGVFMSVPAASAKIKKNGERVKMTDKEFYEYTKRVGALYKAELQSNLENFKKMTPEEAETYLEGETFDKLREEARKSMDEDSTLN
jgi:hypothetical protein